MAESEADTPSTPIEFESKYFEFDGVRLPPFCRGKMEEIADFSLRSSDIWIVTYPKSGPFLPSLVPCTLHVRMSLQGNSSSRIMTKANMFLSSITNINYAFSCLCVLFGDHDPFLFVIMAIRRLFLYGHYENEMLMMLLNTHKQLHATDVSVLWATFRIDESASAFVIDVLFCFIFFLPSGASTLASMFTSADFVAQFPSTTRRVGLDT